MKVLFVNNVKLLQVLFNKFKKNKNQVIKLTVVLFALLLGSTTANALSITLDGTRTILSGTDCGTAPTTYRFGTTASWQGTPLDIIVTVNSEDNDYVLGAATGGGSCVYASGGILSVNLRDKDAADDVAFVDTTITIVAQGTTTPVFIDRITATGFDLDHNGVVSPNQSSTDTDDIYLTGPGASYLSSNTNVSYSTGAFPGGHDVRFQGQSSALGNCDDSPTTPVITCRAAATWTGGSNVNSISSISARFQNDNAYGQYPTTNDGAYRLLQLSLVDAHAEEIMAPNSDFGDAPITYGSASHTLLSLGTILGNGLAPDHEVSHQSSINALGDDTSGTPGTPFYDDEDAVRRNGTLLDGQQVVASENVAIDVTTFGTGYLSAWMDLDIMGTFADPGEQLLTDVFINSTTVENTNLVLPVPYTATGGNTYLRFRFSTNPGATFSGSAGPGEVEDYRIIVIPMSPSYNMVKTSNGPITGPGPLTYTFTFTNTGNAVLSNLTVTDPDIDSGSLTDCPIATLAVGATQSCTATRTITQSQIDANLAISNTATPSAEDPASDPVPEDDPIDNTTTTQIASLTIVKTQTGGDNPVSAPGTIDYTIVVTNDGTTSLTNVVASDVLPDSTAGSLSAAVESGTADGILSVGETFTYTISYAVTQADIDAGTDLTNTASVVTTELPTPEEDTAVTPVTQNDSLTIVKTQTGGDNPVSAPGTIDYTIVVTNDGTTSLTNVVASDVLPDSTAGSLSAAVESGTADGILSVGETFTYTISYAVTQADIDAGTDLTNTASVVTTELPTPEEDTAVTPVTQNDSLTIVKTQTGGDNPVSAPGTIDYTIVVTNDGTTSLTNVVASDVLPDSTAGSLSAAVESGTADGILSVGETFTYTISYAVTQADIDAGTDLTNTASVVTTELPTPEEDTAVTPVTQNDSLTIVKTQTGGDNPVSAPGTIDYTIVVTNDGTTSLTNVVASDVLPDSTAGSLSAAVESGTADGILSVGETFTYTISYAVTQADIDAGTDLTNTASVVTTELPTPEEDTAVTPVTQNDSLTIVKTQTGGDNPVSAPGTIDYTIVVTNDGTTSLTNVVASDVLPDSTAGSLSAAVESGTADGILSVGETFTYTISYAVTQADIDAGTDLTNTASVVTTELPTPEEDTAVTPVTQNDSLTIVKTQTGGDNPVSAPGTIDYTIVVTNDGTTSLTNVVASDVLPDSTAGSLSAAVESGTADGILSVGETFTYTISYAVTQADIDAGTDLTNTASVVTTELPTPEEDTAVTPVTQNDSLTIVKTQTGGDNPVSAPGTIDYTIVVTNDGTTSLTNVVASDVLPDSTAGSLSAAVESGTADGILSVGETFTYTISYAVTQADIDAGTDLTNTASVVTTELPTPEEDTAVTPVTQNDSLTIVKTQTGGDNPVSAPGTIDYTIVVTNDGTTSLTNVVASDVLPDSTAGSLSAAVESGTADGILSVGETFTYTISYAVTQADIDAGTDLTNTASVVTTELPTPEEDTAVTPVTQNDSLTIVKTQTGGDNPVSAPGTIDYTIVVTNDGTTSLTNVVASDVLPDSTAGSLSAAVESGTADGILSVGETFTYTISYAVTQADIDAGTDLTNTASVVTTELPTPEEDTAVTPVTQNDSLTIVKTQTGGDNPVSAPGTIDYTIVVTNDGTTSLTNVVASDVLPDSTAGSLSAAVESGTADGILSVGETFTYTISYAVTQADIDAGTDLTNTASVVTTELPTPEEDTAVTPVTQNDSLTIVKTQTGGDNPVSAPGTIDYTIVVTNDGTTSLTNVVASDVLPDSTAGSLSAAVESGTADGILSVGETFTYTISYAVTQADIDAGTDLTNTASVVTTELPTPEEDTAVTPVTQNDSLTIVKTQTGGDNPVSAPGTIDYTIVVTNDGTTSLTNVVASDVLPDSTAGSLSAAVESGTADGILSVGETFTYTISYAVTQADIDAGTDLTNTASVVTTELPTPEEDTAVTPVTQNDSLTIVKTQTGGDNPVSAPGTIDYTIVVTNDGTTSLTNVVASDVLPDSTAGSLSAAVESGTADGILSVGETFTYTISYAVTQADIDAGTDLTNTASVVTTELPTPEEDTAVTPVTQNDSLTIVKTQTGGDNPVSAPGTIDYTIVVTNDGTTSLTNVVASDVLPDSTAGSLSAAVESGTADGILSVGETFTYTISYAVTQADIDAGTDLTNTASVVTTELPTPEEDTAVTPVTQNDSLTIVKTQTGGDNPVSAPGTIDYTIVVTNDGTTSLTNVVASDVLPDSTAGSLSAAVESGTADGILSVGETFTYTISYAVTQADIDAGTDLTNTASVVTTELPTPEEDTAVTPVTQNDSLTIVKTQTGGDNPVSAPGTIDYTIVVTNDGTTSLTNVVASDVLPDSTAGSLSAAVESGTADGILSVGETFTYTISYAVTQADIDAGTDLTNTASVVTTELPTPEEDTAVTPVTQNDSLTIVKTQTGGDNPVSAPGTIDYTIVVTNDGTTSLTNVVASDVLPDSTAGSLSAAVESGTADGILSVGETFTYTISYAVTQADIDAGTDLTNTASVVTTELPTPEEDTAVTPVTQNDSLTIVKTQTGGDNPVSAPGTIDYTIVVTNDGTTSLTNVVASDVLPDSTAGSLSAAVESGTADGILSVGETFTYTISYAVTQADIDAGTDLTNTASVVTTELPTPEEDTAVTPVTQNDSLTIVKTQTGGDNPVSAPGTIDYTIVVTNDGTTSLTNVVASDVLPDSTAGSLSAAVESGTADGILSVGETFTYTISYAVTQADIDAGTDLTNTASVVTTELPTPEEDTAVTPVTQNDSLTIVKTQTGGDNPVSAPGTIDYTIVVTNDGTTSLTNVVASDVLPDSTAGSLSAAVESGTADGILSVGETFTYTISYAVTQADIDAGTDLTNTASVVTTELPTPEEDTAVTPVTQNDSLTIVKTQTGGDNPVSAPGTIDYTIVVTNDGTTSLTNVVASDVLPDSTAGSLSAAVESGTADGILSVGETFTYTISYAVTQADIDAGTDLTNTASVVTTELPTPEEDTAVTPVTQNDSLTIVKTQTGGDNPVSAPGTIDYTIVVTNDGTTSLTNVVASDVLPDSTAGSLSAAVESGTADGILSVGETFTYTISYAVTQADIDAGTDLTNTASVVTTELPTPEEDTAVTPVTQNDSLTIVKTQTGGDNPVSAPGTIDYTIVVTNDGTTSLTNVVASDVLPDSTAGSLSAAVESGTADGILSVGETFTYTISYAVTQADIDAGTDLTNTASVVTTELPTPEEDTAVTPVTQNDSLTIVKTQTGGDNPVSAPGTIDYTIVVTNDGTTSLTNVVASDVLPDSTAGSLSAAVESGTADGILSVGETFTYTISYAVTQADIDAGTDLTNTASVVTTELPTPEEDTAVTPVTQNDSLTIVKTQTGGDNPVSAPGTIDYTIVVTNDGTTSLTNVVASDVLPDSTAGSLSAAVESGTADGILSVGETFTYTISYAVTQADIDAGTDLTNTASVVTTELPTPEEDTAVTPVTQNDSLTIVKTQTGGDNPVSAPGTIDYTIVVTNDGTTSLTNVVASDVLPDSTAGSLSAAVESGTADGILSVGETFTYTISYAVTQADIDAGTDLTNTASVVTTELPTPEEDTAVTPVTQNDSLTIVKTQTGGDNPVSAPGTIDYTIVVTNDGTTSLTNVVASDVLPDSTAGSLSAAVESGTADGILSVGETFTYTISYAVTQADIDAGTDLTNTASVVTTELPTPEEDTAVTPVTQNDSLTIVKTQTGGDNPVSAPGTIDYTIVVTNDGTTSLTNVVASDVLPDSTAGSLSAAVESGTADGILSVGETFTYTISYAVTQADIDAGTDLTNTASVVTTELPTPEEDTAVTPVTQNDSLTIVKTQTGGDNPVSAPGTIDYTIVVTNDGTTSLTNVVASDVLPDSTAGSLSAAVESGTADGILSVGETFTYTISYAVTQADIDAGTDLTNTASVVTTELPTPEEDTAVTPVTQNDSLTIVKTQTGGDNPVSAPGTIDYTIVVTNDGTTSLTNVVASDVLPDSTAGSLSAAVESGTADGILSVGETFTYTISYAVTQADIDAGTDLTNTASVVTTELPTPEEDTAVTPVTQNDSLTIVKTQTGGDNPVSAPGTIDYTIVVTNDGTTSLTNVVASDVLPDSTAGSLSAAVESGTADGILSVGETFTYTISYAVTQADIDAGTDLTNTASVVTTELPTPEEDTAVTPVTQNDSLTIVKTQTGGDNPVSAPGTIDYTIVVTNDGTTSLTNVVASDVLPDSTAGSLSAAVESGTADGILSVGETFTYTISYAVTQADIDAGTDLTNTASVVTTELPTPEEDTAVTPVTRIPSYTMAKSSDTPSMSSPGTITYTFAFVNTGNVELTNLTVADTNIDSGTLSGCPIASLAVGASQSCSATRVVSQTQIDAGPDIVNTAIPSATGPDGTTPVTEDDTPNDNSTATDTLQSPTAVNDTQSNPGVPSPSNPTILTTIGSNDSDPDGTIDPATVDLNPSIPGIQNTITNVDGTWTVDTSGNVTFTPNATLTGNPSQIPYTINDNDGNTSNTAILTVTYGNAPTAFDDTQANSGIPSPANPTVLTTIGSNDTDPDGTIDPATVDLNPTVPGIQNTLTNGDGTWTVDASGNVIFTPNSSLTGDPTPIPYTINDNDGNTSNTAILTVTYGEAPIAVNDTQSNPGIPSPTNPTVLTTIGSNDNDPDGTIDPATVDLNPAVPGIQNTLTNGDGTWTVDASGNVTFTPNSSLTGNPTPIPYSINDNDGNTSNTAILTVTYGNAPTAFDDSQANPGVPSPSNPTVLTTIGSNDTDPDGTIDPATVDLNPAVPGIQNTLTNGEGTWTVDVSGNVTFTPNSSLTGNPTSIPYVINDNDGNTSNQATLTVTYGTAPSGVVSGIVYEDTNGNGTQDSGEFGIPGVAVLITEANGDTQTLSTDANGNYSTTVAIGNTTIDIQENTLPGGSVHTEGTDPTIVTVPANGSATDVDGYQPAINSGQVIGVVYDDLNNNGTQDATEPGISGVEVIVTDSQGNTQTLTTDSDGTYGATVPAGSTIVDINNSTLPVGSVQTEGTDATTVTVPVNGIATDRDGFHTPIIPPLLGLVQGVVYLDANNNGQQDNGETGIPNVRVNITDSAGTTTTIVTDGNGQYSQSVFAGNTTIDIVDSDVNPTYTRTEGTDPTIVTVTIGNVANDVDGFAPAQTQPPVAVNDSKLNQPLGQAVTVQTVSNDSDPNNNLDPTTVKLRDPSGNPVTTLVVPGEGTWTVDTTTGDITFTPETDFLGDPTPVQYTVTDTTGLESNIATVTIDYEEPAAIIGTVWLDRDKDNVIDSNEDRKAGWTLEIKDKDGNVIATTITDSQGNYSVTGLIPDEYTVDFYNTRGTLIATKSTGGPLKAGETLDLPLPVDPSGVVYDSTTRQPIEGVTLQLLNSQGIPVDTTCLGDGQQNQVTADDGIYTFDVYPDAHPSCQNGETYTIKVVSTPVGYFTDSTIIPPQTGVYDSDSNEGNCTLDVIANSGSCEVQGQPDAPQQGQDTTYYLDFTLNSGDGNVIFNHIPLDAEFARVTDLDDDTVLLSKTANKKQLSVGDQLYYTVRAENTSEDEVEVDVRDDLPKGFKFVSNTAKLTRAGADNKLGTADDIVSTITATGTDPISFNSLTLQGNEVVQIGYILKIGLAAAQGDAVNTVQVFGAGTEDDIASNVATATVTITVDSVLDQSTLIGKVFHDRDGDGYQDPANVTGLTVKSDYFGWNSLHLGGINGRISVLDDPNDYRKVIRMPFLIGKGQKNDFKVTTKQGTVINVDNRGQVTTAHKGQKKKGLTGQDIRVTTRRIRGLPTQTPVKAMRVPEKETDVLEITMTNYGIHEEGIPGVRLATVKGLLIETDGYGRYHLPDVDGGRRGWGKNISLKVDPATLPDGAKFTTENPRVLRLTSAALNKVNFGIKLPVEEQYAPVQSVPQRQTSETPVAEKSAPKWGGVSTKVVRVTLGDSFFESGTHIIEQSQMSNIQLLADNIKQYGKAEITLDDHGAAKQIIYKRAQAVRQALYKKLGPELMKSVKINIK